MNEYRNEARQVAKDARWTFWRFLPLFLIVVVVLSGVGFGLNSLGLIGKTAVEREVFEQSYQRSESIKAEIAMNEATLVEIERKLSNPNLDENTRHNLEAQASAARLRIATAKGRK
jgi:hypothetical protein